MRRAGVSRLGYAFVWRSPLHATTSVPENDTCEHERRPGMTVCLHCRHTALVAARARRRKRLMYAGSVLLVAVVIAGAGAVTVGVVKNRATAAARTAGTAAVTPEAPMQHVAQVRALPATAAQRPATAPPPSNAPAPESSAAPSPPLVPILARGETTLGAGITATRSDNSVIVLFDTDGLRTRRRDKFEKLVRETLPAVYGRRADSLLAGMPDGTIAGQGDLLTELPARGVHLALNDGWKLTLFPETRPGRDGPLVIRYRVAVIQ